jgi:thiol-disulfide isomerase/thioredoxin
MGRGFHRAIHSSLLICALGCAAAPPAFKQHTSGTEFALADLRGRVVLLNFWADWCGPCIEEIPQLLNVASGFGQQVLFVAVYYADEFYHRDKVERWLAQQPAFFAKHVSWGNMTLRHEFPHRALPTTYVIGKDGRVIETFIGAEFGPEHTAKLREAIQRGLAQIPPAAQK